MATVRITGWSIGLRKVSMTTTIREYTELGLKESKAATDNVLSGGVVELTVADILIARTLAKKLKDLGGIAGVVEEPV